MYIIIGMIASASGICRVCMMQQMHPTNMLGMEMNIIAGVVLGGVALTGGAGTPDRLYSWYFPDHPGTELHDPSWNSDNLE